MRRVLQVIFMVIVLMNSVAAQDKPVDKPREDRPLSFYKLEFALRELQDGKLINTRNYSMTVENGDRGNVQVGARVPVNSGDKGIQYMEVGTNINCRVVGKENFASLNTVVEVSSFALPEQSQNSSTPPVLRQLRANMAAVVPENKQTIIGSIDDANSTKRYEIAVTATKLK